MGTKMKWLEMPIGVQRPLTITFSIDLTVIVSTIREVKLEAMSITVAITIMHFGAQPAIA